MHGHTNTCRPRQNAEVEWVNGASKDGTGGRGRKTCQTVLKTQDVTWQVLGRNLKDWERVTTLSLPGWRPRSPEEEVPAWNLLQKDKSASPWGCFPPGLLGTKAEAYGDAESREAKAALIQHARKQGTWSAGTHVRFCPFIPLPFSNYSSSVQSYYISVLERQFGSFQRNESNRYKIWTFTPCKAISIRLHRIKLWSVLPL